LEAQQVASLDAIDAQLAALDAAQRAALASLDAQVASLNAAEQVALARIDAQIVAVNQELQATLTALSQQEQNVVRDLEVQAVLMLDQIRVQLVDRLAQLQAQEAEAAARLQAVLGDRTFDEFVAEKQAQAVLFLQNIDRTLGIYLGTVTQLLQGAPSFQHGTSYVPRTGLAMLHEGEKVVPRGGAEGVRRGGGSSMVVNLGGITLNVTGSGRVDAKRTVDDIEDELVRRIKGVGKLRPAIQDLAERSR
jgi:hypothetical protein